MSKDQKDKKSNQDAEDVAKIMVENMKANMTDPDFLHKKELMQDEVTKKVIKQREERRKLKEQKEK